MITMEKRYSVNTDDYLGTSYNIKDIETSISYLQLHNEISIKAIMDKTVLSFYVRNYIRVITY